MSIVGAMPSARATVWFHQSSTIDRIVDDDRASTLGISFRDAGKYVYDGVPSSLFEAICRAAVGWRLFQ